VVLVSWLALRLRCQQQLPLPRRLRRWHRLALRRSVECNAAVPGNVHVRCHRSRYRPIGWRALLRLRASCGRCGEQTSKRVEVLACTREPLGVATGTARSRFQRIEVLLGVDRDGTTRGVGGSNPVDPLVDGGPRLRADCRHRLL
jgi:hypothetical protein